MSNTGSYQPKGSKSSQNHFRQNHFRRRRRHRRPSWNADLFDENDEDERDAWTKKPMSPESQWKEVLFQQRLKEKMRRNIKAKSEKLQTTAPVVDGKGRPVTLAERIVRFKLYETAMKTDGEEPSTSYATTNEVDKKTNLSNLLHEYIQQRRSESALGSQLLDEISEAKSVLNDNEFKRALSAKKATSRASSISLGDSATIYNVKAGSLARQNTEDCDNITKGEAVHNGDNKGNREIEVECEVHIGVYDLKENREIVGLSTAEQSDSGLENQGSGNAHDAEAIKDEHFEKSRNNESDEVNQEIAAICNGDKNTETDSAIDSFDFTDQNGSFTGDTVDTLVNRVYQFKCCDLERPYSLPELVLSNVRAVFPTEDETANRKRGQKVTIISSNRSDTNAETSRVSPTESTSDDGTESETQAPPDHPESSEREPTNTNLSNTSHVGIEEATSAEDNNTTHESNEHQNKRDSTLTDVELTTHQSLGSIEDISECPQSISNTFEAKDGRGILEKLLSPGFDRVVDPHSLSSQAPTDREKRVIGLYNELKCFSMLHRSQPRIAIAMKTKPNGSSDLHIEWGAINYSRNRMNDSRYRGEALEANPPTCSNPLQAGAEEGPEGASIMKEQDQTSKQAPEFIYLRDVSFSQYVSRVLAKSKNFPYQEHHTFKSSTTLKASLCPDVLLKEPKKKSIDSYGRDTRLKLPVIQPDGPVRQVNSKSHPLDSAQQVVRDAVQRKIGTRRREALERRRKRLKLPQIKS